MTLRRALAHVLTLGWLAVLVGVLLRARPAYAGVVVTVHPSVLSAGGTHGAMVTVTTPDASMRSLVLTATAGRIRDVSQVSPGVFTARYDPPAGRNPDVALVVATAGVETGCAAVTLVGRYHLAIRVEPRARVAVTVAGQQIERVASRRGRLEMYLDVPPGAVTAEVSAEDSVGNRTVTQEDMAPPASHRLAMVDGGVMDNRHRRVWVLAANEDGSLAAEAPRVTVDGGEVSIERTSPGVFRAAVALPRRASGLTARVRAEAQRAAPVEIAVESLPAVVATVGIAIPSRVHAGERVTAHVAARDVDGAEVGGVAPALTLRATGGTLGAAMQQPDETYAVAWTAPERAGEAVIEARYVRLPAPLQGAPRPDSVARAVAQVSVVAGVPARWALREAGLVVGVPGNVVITAMDRYGNPTDAVIAGVDVVGGTWQAQHLVGDGLRVTLVPQRTDFSLMVRGADGTVSTLAGRATTPPPPIEGAVVARVGTNLHGLYTGGVRVRGHWAFTYRRWRLLVGAGTGYEGGQTHDALGRGAEINALPLEARVGGALVEPHFRVRVWGWLGGWWIQRTATGANGVGDSAASLIPGAGIAVAADLRLGGLALGLEAGYDLVHLDSGPVTGNPSGVYAALAWSYGAW